MMEENVPVDVPEADHPLLLTETCVMELGMDAGIRIIPNSLLILMCMDLTDHHRVLPYKKMQVNTQWSYLAESHYC